MWFGTKEFSLWVPTPVSGADVSSAAWGDAGTYLNGGGFGINSYNSHKTYDFSWRSSSSRETAQLMKSFFDGSFGRGKLYFQDPLTLDTNVLPARWADPSITADYEGPSLVPGVQGTAVSRTNTRRLQLPVRAMHYDFDNYVQPSILDSALYVPIPEGYGLILTAFFEATGDVGLRGAPSIGGVPGTTSVVSTPTAPTANTNLLSSAASYGGNAGEDGAYIWIGGDTPGSVYSGSVTLHALQGRLIRSDRIATWLPQPYTHWYGGQGNSGVRFEGPPSYINMNGVSGGQIEFAASFVESEL